MNLKASLFNKSIFKTDLKRFWIASLLYTVILFFLVPFQYVAREERFYNIINTIPDDYLMTSFAGSTYPGIFVGILCGGVFALMIFMYINSTPAISFYHSLPYRRTTIYFTKLLSGTLLLVVPIVINLLILLGAKGSGTFIPAHFEHLFMWAYLQLAYTLIVFLGVSFVAMFTGNFMYLIAVSGICVITPLLTIVFAEGLLSDHLYGYVGTIEEALNWVYLIPKYMMSPRAFIYLALAILFVIFGCCCIPLRYFKLLVFLKSAWKVSTLDASIWSCRHYRCKYDKQKTGNLKGFCKACDILHSCGCSFICCI